MRKSLNTSFSDSLSEARVFGIPLEEVQHSGQPGHEVPLLVRSIVEYIEEHGGLHLGLFLVNGNAERVEWLRQRYDSGVEVNLEKEADLSSAVSLLRLFLQELPEPVIPAGLQAQIMQLYQDYSSEEELGRNMKYFLQQLPQVNYSLLRFLCRFLSGVVSLQEESWSIGALAAVFGPDIFHLDTDVEDLREQESVSRILAELLENQEEFFDSEDDDISNTNDYSSINDQVNFLSTVLSLKLVLLICICTGYCENLMLFRQSPEKLMTRIRLECVFICSIIQRSIRAAVEQHLLDLQTSFDKELGSYEMCVCVCVCVRERLIAHCTLLCYLSLFLSAHAWSESCPINFPSIDFTCMHLQREGNPVPVFMSWQEETESGEAQLSPLAGCMMPPPLEEDTQPLLARRFLEFGHSQRFLQQDHDATSSTKALPCGRPRRASLPSKDSLKGDTVSQQFTKKLQNLKKKIKQFEEQFEKERNYKPSHADKAADPKVLKWMTDLTKIRKQLKDAKHKAESELTPQTRPRSNTLPKSFGSTLDQSAHEDPVESEAWGHRPTREETLELLQHCIQTKRAEDGWPEDIRKMTKEQLASEKTVLQKNLLYYEGIHGRPVTREERLIVKPLYDRYRLVKQMLTRVSITPIIASPSSKRRNQMLQPIIEGETAHFCGEIEEEEEEEEGRGQQENVELQSEGLEIIMDPVAQPSSLQPTQENVLSSGKLNLDLRLSSSNASSMPELLEQLWKARAEKKKLWRTIREFEDEFYQQNGRNVQKEDRMPMMDEYKEYKRIKAKLRLLEVLISKQDSSKSI
uniref:Protein FAM13B-like n=1 Tax=Sinocyclocheilus anshuiensis TaxID=1608454 RepID=A0A671MA49_9TELE